MFKMWRSVMAVACLGYFSLEDLRKRALSGRSLLLAGMIGMLFLVCEGDYQDWRTLLRFLPGLVCLGLGWLTKEQIGYGDGLMLLCLGCFLKLPALLSVCFTALTLAGITAMFLLLVLRREKKTEIPFVPFLLLGYGVSLLM